MTISVDGLYLNGFSPQLNVLLSRNSLFIVQKKEYYDHYDYYVYGYDDLTKNY